MKKKISAVCAALLLTASVFSGCSKKPEDASQGETSINIIQDGTQAPVSDGAASEVTSFFDPGANIDLGGDQTAPEITEAETEATLPSNHEEIVSMIEGGVVTEKAPVITEYNVDYKTRYGYNTLNDKEKALYADILEAVKSVRTKVQIDDSVTDEMWIKVYGCLYMQEPQLFWLTSKKVVKGKLWYWETDPEVIASMQKEIEAKAAQVLAQAEGKDTYGKLKVFHDYITLNNNFVKEEGFNQTIYGGFVKG